MIILALLLHLLYIWFTSLILFTLFHDFTSLANIDLQLLNDNSPVLFTIDHYLFKYIRYI